MRRRMSKFTGWRVKAPSRSTRWILAAPAAANCRATSSGESEKTVESFCRPWRRRTAFPPWMSIAGITWNAISSPRSAARAAGGDLRPAAERAEVGQDGESGPLALLGVELDRHPVPFSHGGGERDAVRRPAGDDGRILRFHVIGVDEVEVRPGRDAAEHGVIQGEVDPVPPHVRHLERNGPPVRSRPRKARGEPHHLAAKKPDPLVPPELLALGEEHLQAEADPQERPILAENVGKERKEPLPAKVLHAVAEGAHPGQDDPGATGKLRGAPAHDRRKPERLERLAPAAQVSHPVVDDPDGLRSRHPSTPFDECTPFTRGSMRTASDMALPSPLKIASTVWWAFDPYGTLTWMHAPEDWENARRNSETSSRSNDPTFSPGRGQG